MSDAIPFDAKQLAAWTGGELRSGEPEAHFTGVTIDSRSIERGMLFVAIRGPHHDGHTYLANAEADGAAGALVEAGCALPSLDPTWPLVSAPDSTRALGALAAGHRSDFGGPLIAITGSSGKTTTKELCAAILEQVGPCLRTQGNLNNQYGLPLTLLRRAQGDRFAVIEIGMNHPGEIAPLAAIAAPGIAVITNVGTAHIEFMGSPDGIAQEKGAILDGLGSHQFAVLNADDPQVMSQAGRTAAQILRFGRNTDAEICASQVERVAGGFRFDLHTPVGTRTLHVPGVSETLIPNSLAAAAAAWAAGATLDHIEEGLGSYTGVSGRMQLRAGRGGALFIDDSYNANPQSMSAALRSLIELAAQEHRRPVAVLGDMGELGAHAAPAHREIGAYTAECKVAQLIAVGKNSAGMADGAQEAGLASSQIHRAPSADEAALILEGLLQPDDLVLIKGSRSMRMERVLDTLGAEEIA